MNTINMNINTANFSTEETIEEFFSDAFEEEEIIEYCGTLPNIIIYESDKTPSPPKTMKRYFAEDEENMIIAHKQLIKDVRNSCLPQYSMKSEYDSVDTLDKELIREHVEKGYKLAEEEEEEEEEEQKPHIIAVKQFESEKEPPRV